MKSILVRLIVSLVLAALLLATAGGAVLFVQVRASLTVQFDDALATTARALASLVEFDGENLEFDFSVANMPEFSRAEDAAFFQLWLAGGEALARSPSLAGADLPRRERRIETSVFWDLRLPDGRPGRAVELHFLPKIEDAESDIEEPIVTSPVPPPSLVLVVAQDRTSLARQLATVASGLILFGCVLLGGIASLVPWLVRRGLAPLAHVARCATTIDAETLGTRFPTERLPTELVPITERLNDLLARLESAFHRERRFTADVAHELRTPIAELRSLIEVEMKWPNEPESAKRALSEALDVTLRMEGIVTSLLALARCESGHQTICRESFDPVELVRDAWRLHEVRAREKNLVTTLSLSDGLEIESDRTILASIVGNLLENAVDHSPPGGRVEVRLDRAAGGLVLVIRNTDASLEPDDLPHLFESFWQKDAARADSSHSGLGLAVASAFARLLGMELRAALPEGDEIEIALSIPIPDGADHLRNVRST